MKEYKELSTYIQANAEIAKKILEALLQLSRDHENRRNILELTQDGVQTVGFTVNAMAFPDLVEQFRADGIPFVAYEKKLPSSYAVKNLTNTELSIAKKIISDYGIKDDVYQILYRNGRNEIVMDATHKDILEDICESLSKDVKEIQVKDYSITDYIVKVKRDDCIDRDAPPDTLEFEIGGIVRKAWEKVVEEKQAQAYEQELSNDPEIALNNTIYDLSEIEKRQLEIYLAKDRISCIITKENDGTYKVETNEKYAEKLNEAYTRTIFDLTGDAGAIRERKLGQEIRTINEIMERAEKGEEFCLIDIRMPNRYIIVNHEGEKNVCTIFDGEKEIGSFEANDKEGTLRDRIYGNPTMYITMTMEEKRESQQRQEIMEQARLKDYEFYSREELELIEFDKKINEMIQESISHKDLNGLKNINTFIESFKLNHEKDIPVEKMQDIEDKLYQVSERLKNTNVVTQEYTYHRTEKTQEKERTREKTKERTDERETTERTTHSSRESSEFEI